MDRSVSAPAGWQPLRPKARLLRTLGDELISSEIIAVIELVKNAYDADATRVLVRFTGPLTKGHGRIEIADNGHGMSLHTIQNTWMEPATLFKKQNSRSPERNRRVLGEKGIGRFASSRLADDLLVITRSVETNREVKVLFDWTQFDDEEKYLDEIEILWEESEPNIITPHGEMRSVWGARLPKDEPLIHGTLLRMDRLRADWDLTQFEELQVGLSRLVSPFLMSETGEKTDKFDIYLELPLEFSHLSGAVVPPRFLSNPHYTIRGEIDKEGFYRLASKVKGEERLLEGQFRIPVRMQTPKPQKQKPAKKEKEEADLTNEWRKPQCGPFSIDLLVWDRDSLQELADLYGSTVRDVRRDLDAIAGVNVYRDGFRVMPYGEPRNDWLRLDLRRVQNPTLRLSNNQIVGYVLISADGNRELRDQSNREGIMEGQALRDFSYLVTKVIALVEERRYKTRNRRTEKRRGGVFTDFDLSRLRNLITEKYPHDQELSNILKATEEDLEQRVEVAKEVLARYRRLATLGQLVDVVLHDGRAPLSKIRNQADLGLRDVERADSGTFGEIINSSGQRFSTISDQSEVLATVFRRIEPFAGRKRGRPIQVSLEQVIRDAFSVLDTEITRTGARTSLPDTDTQVTLDASEMQQVIINLLQNSLYWLHQVPKDSRQISVQVMRRLADEIQILFSDSGPGVDPEVRDLIFDPYFSTKPDGIGLGLSIAGEIVKEFYNGDLELLDNGPLLGATFRIILRRRV